MKESSLGAQWRRLQGWYHGLASRDQLALKLLCLALVAFLAWALVWAPAKAYRDAGRLAAERQYSDLVWMVNNQSQARNAVGASRGSDASLPQGQSLLSVVSGSARGQGITLQRFEPRGDTRINIWLEDVEFNRMMTWLEAMNRDFGISVEQISVDRSKQEGRVQARLSLSA